MAGELVARAGGHIRSVIAPSRRLQAIACRAVDGAYYGAPVTTAIRAARPSRSPPKIIVPPPKTAIPPPGTPHGGTEAERHGERIAITKSPPTAASPGRTAPATANAPTPKPPSPASRAAAAPPSEAAPTAPRPRRSPSASRWPTRRSAKPSRSLCESRERHLIDRRTPER